MECRIGCAACCIAASISSPIPGMPGGKPAGVRCIHLDFDNRCRIWGTADYPDVCRRFTPRIDVCGSSDSEAFALIAELERRTKPGI